jgi:hypothetical protein
VRPSSEWISRLVNGRDLEVRPTSGGEWNHLVTLNAQRPAQNPFPIEYTPDGRWILYADRDAAGRDSLFRVSPGGGTPERMGDFPLKYARNGLFRLSPDGRNLLTFGKHSLPEFWLLENFEPKAQPVH